MKKTLLIVTLLVTALGTLGVGVVAAQAGNPPYGSQGVADGTGILHDYIEAALADTLGLSVEEFQARSVDATFYEIALAEGFSAEEIPALIGAARADALAAAASDGVIAQEAAQWMNARGSRNGGMNGGNGLGDGTCTLCDGQNTPLGGQFNGANSSGRGNMRAGAK